MMTITNTSSGIAISSGDYIFTMKRTVLFVLDRDNVPAYHIEVYHEYGGKLDEMFFSDCTAKTAWHNFYHMARRQAWYENGR